MSEKKLPYFRDSLPHSGSEDACTQQCDKLKV